MKIYISVDIEGICDVVNQEHTNKKGFLNQYAREQMSREANAAIEGAFAAGATEVVVNDSHGGMTNIIPHLIHEDAYLITGTTKPHVMMEGLTADFDAVMFVGYHARNNAPGVLSHTISGRTVDNIWINDVLVGETGLNAGFAGALDIPVIMVTGDNILCQEATALLGPALTAVQVKEAITRYSAKCLHPHKAIELIKQNALTAVKNIANCQPLKFNSPITGKIQFLNSGMADGASRLPNSVRLSGDTLSYTADSYLDVFKALRTMIALAY